MIERKAQSAGSLAGRDGLDAAGAAWIELDQAAGEGVATTLPPDTAIATQARTGRLGSDAPKFGQDDHPHTKDGAIAASFA